MRADRPGPARLSSTHGAVLAALGGALGALLRYGVGLALPTPTDGFPWAILLVNLTGCAVLAALPVLEVVRRDPRLPVLLGTGLLGGYTTMSSWAEGTVALAKDGRPLTAATYLVSTLGGCLLLAWLVGRQVPPTERAELETEEGDE